MRLYGRFNADSDITCEIAGKTYGVTLYDISCGGCMVETNSSAAEIGANIVVHLNDEAEASGVIVWRHDKNAGIKFDAVLSSGVLEDMGFVVSAEEFDSDDPRDRFGIPLVKRANSADALGPAYASMPMTDFASAKDNTET